jgi:hypothetical protein
MCVRACVRVWRSAYTERLIMEQLLLRVDAAPDAATRVVLQSLASLFALGCMERDLKWFIIAGLLRESDVQIVQVRL